MILIDATGEFRSLGSSAVHVALGSCDNEPSARLVSIPHQHLRESDRNAFIAPSGGSQLPKLRAAVRSLRLAAVLEGHEPSYIEAKGLAGHTADQGLITKAGQDRLSLDLATRHFMRQVENPYGQFDIRALPAQIMAECVWPSDKSVPGRFGGIDQNAQGYVSSMISRIDDLLQTKEIMDVISGDPTIPSLLTEISSWLKRGDPGILRVSLRNLTFSHGLREILVNVVGHSLLTMARRGDFHDNPVVVGLDEAHQFFDATVGDEVTTHLDAFDLIAKEGRKYGLTVCLATQRPGDLPPAVLSQVGMLIVHRLADGKDRQRVEQAAAELDMSAMKLLPGLVPGEAVFMGVDFPVPVSVKVRPPRYKPESDGPRYSTGWTISNVEPTGASQLNSSDSGEGDEASTAGEAA
jgi:hypothetical protein